MEETISTSAIFFDTALSAAAPAPAANAVRPRICLTMIVKNESRVIERALRSAIPFIDSYAICDTGSTDDTKEIISRVMAEAGKPGIIQDDAWVNFGHNRSLALKAARDQEPEGWSIMMDADDSLAGTPPPADFWTSIPPSLNAFRINITHGSLRHHRTQIFSNRHLWKYDGAVHEYPLCITGESIGVFPETAWMIARCEGARSEDPLKYVRDAFALRKELETKPKEPRALFYLAQSYRDAGLTQEAIAAYKERIAVEGWAQERYMSYVNLIKMTEDLEEKIAYGWKAVEIDHTRLEAPYYILFAARKQNKFSQEVLAMGLLSKVREPSPGYLFAEQYIYDYAFDDELAIISYWKGHPKISFEAALRSRVKAPAHHYERIDMNIKFAREKLGLPALPALPAPNAAPEEKKETS